MNTPSEANISAGEEITAIDNPQGPPSWRSVRRESVTPGREGPMVCASAVPSAGCPSLWLVVDICSPFYGHVVTFQPFGAGWFIFGILLRRGDPHRTGNCVDGFGPCARARGPARPGGAPRWPRESAALP